MEHYDVLISDKANEDMDDIYNYIAENLQEPVIAANQYNRIADAILTLEQMPDRIKLMNSAPERSKGLRPLYVDNYTVFFTITGRVVNIARVLYSSSDICSRLSEN
jgi:plasmid stabilization system protein ParE